MRIARDLHPVAWWSWALGLAVGATFTTNPILLLLLIASVVVVVLTCRNDQPWARSFRLYAWLAVIVVVTRVVMRVVLGGDAPGHVLLALPEIPLPDAAAGITLFGEFTREELLAASYDGLRLAAIILAVGAANAVANPKRLMKSLPPALHEIGTAMTVAITVIPQFADSAQRVRAAQELRGGPTGRLARIQGLRRLLIPVLEDAFDRSLALAAGMDARGYGRSGEQSARQRRATGAVMILGLLGVCVGVYAFLDSSVPRLLGLPMLIGGTVVALVGMALAGRRVQRTRYRPDRWRAPEIVIALAGAASGLGMWLVQRLDYAVAHPSVVEVPEVTPLAVGAVLLAIVPVWLAPPPLTVRSREAAADAPRDEVAAA